MLVLLVSKNSDDALALPQFILVLPEQGLGRYRDVSYAVLISRWAKIRKKAHAHQATMLTRGRALILRFWSRKNLPVTRRVRKIVDVVWTIYGKLRVVLG